MTFCHYGSDMFYSDVFYFTSIKYLHSFSSEYCCCTAELFNELQPTAEISTDHIECAISSSRGTNF